ncbi:MAG: DUF885 domain-containing protein, partial [Gammaproteobacteria bacterium]|nr:DUF885 domain-containing protein [Gammaproteobacteria bacterium]
MNKAFRWIPAASAAVAALAMVLGAAAQPVETAPTVQSAQTEDQRLMAFFEEVFQRNLKDSPIFQSQLGIKGPDYGKWGDLSDGEAIRQNELTKQDLARLRAEFRYETLSEPVKISYRIFEYLQDRTLRNFPWRFHNYAFSTQNNPVTGLAAFLQNAHRIDDVSDAEAYISRLNGIELAARQGIEGMDIAAGLGIVPTSFSFDPVLADGRNVLKGAPFDGSAEDSAVLADFRGKVAKLEIPDAEKQRLIDAAIVALKGPFSTGVNAVLARIESLRSKSVGPNGVWKLPDGDDFYKAQIDFWTSEPKLTADEIHNIGLAEVARIRGEMETIMHKVGFKGDLPAFFNYLRTDPANFYPNTDEGRQAYLDQAKAYIDAVYADVGKYFNILP